MQVILVLALSAISKPKSYPQTKKGCSLKGSVLFSILLPSQAYEPGTVFADWSHIRSFPLSFFKHAEYKYIPIDKNVRNPVIMLFLFQYFSCRGNCNRSQSVLTTLLCWQCRSRFIPTTLDTNLRAPFHLRVDPVRIPGTLQCVQKSVAKGKFLKCTMDGGVGNLFEHIVSIISCCQRCIISWVARRRKGTLLPCASWITHCHAS